MILTKETLSAGPNIGTGEGVAHSKRWYVALVRMHHEKKVAERLDKMGIENFVPVQQEIHQWSDRRKVVESVLLPMMVFVHFSCRSFFTGLSGRRRRTVRYLLICNIPSFGWMSVETALPISIWCS